MKMKESVIETIMDSIINMELPDFDIIETSISPPYITDKENNICRIDVKHYIKRKNK